MIKNCQIPNKLLGRSGFEISILNFGIVSDFDIRISDFEWNSVREIPA